MNFKTDHLIKYLGLAISFTLFMNILGLIEPFIPSLETFATQFSIFIYLPLAFGIVMAILITLERKKLKMSSALFLIVVSSIIFDSIIGVIALCLLELLYQINRPYEDNL